VSTRILLFENLVSTRAVARMSVDRAWSTHVDEVDEAKVLTAAQCCAALGEVLAPADVALIFTQLNGCSRKWHTAFCAARGHAVLVHALAAAFFRMVEPRCVGV
jgi:hypothetical protein